MRPRCSSKTLHPQLPCSSIIITRAAALGAPIKQLLPCGSCRGKLGVHLIESDSNLPFATSLREMARVCAEHTEPGQILFSSSLPSSVFRAGPSSGCCACCSVTGLLPQTSLMSEGESIYEQCRDIKTPSLPREAKGKTLIISPVQQGKYI